MTCIVGIAQDGKVYMGGDSAGVAGWDLEVRADQKVFQNGDFIMGFTTSFRMGQLLRYKFTPPLHHETVDTEAYMVTSFVDEVRNCLRNGGYAKNVSGEESGGTFLVGYKGRIFKIENDYQISIPSSDYTACGCGEQIALGSLYSSTGKPPAERITQALEASEKFSAGVRGPFITLEL